MRRLNLFTVPSRKAPAMLRLPLDLTPEQRDESDRIRRRLLAVVEDEIRGMAELLASKPDREILGEAEFQVRHRVHEIGARAIEAALDKRKKATVLENGVSDCCLLSGNPVFPTLSLLVLRTYKGGTRAPAPDARVATAPAS